MHDRVYARLRSAIGDADRRISQAAGERSRATIVAGGYRWRGRTQPSCDSPACRPCAGAGDARTLRPDRRLPPRSARDLGATDGRYDQWQETGLEIHRQTGAHLKFRRRRRSRWDRETKDIGLGSGNAAWKREVLADERKIDLEQLRIPSFPHGEPKNPGPSIPFGP